MQAPLFSGPNIAPLKNVGHILYLKHTFHIGNSNLGGLLKKIFGLHYSFRGLPG